MSHPFPVQPFSTAEVCVFFHAGLHPYLSPSFPLDNVFCTQSAPLSYALFIVTLHLLWNLSKISLWDQKRRNYQPDTWKARGLGIVYPVTLCKVFFTRIRFCLCQSSVSSTQTDIVFIQCTHTNTIPSKDCVKCTPYYPNSTIPCSASLPHFFILFDKIISSTWIRSSSHS